MGSGVLKGGVGYVFGAASGSENIEGKLDATLLLIRP